MRCLLQYILAVVGGGGGGGGGGGLASCCASAFLSVTESASLRVGEGAGSVKFCCLSISIAACNRVDIASFRLPDFPFARPVLEVGGREVASAIEACCNSFFSTNSFLQADVGVLMTEFLWLSGLTLNGEGLVRAGVTASV